MRDGRQRRRSSPAASVPTKPSRMPSDSANARTTSVAPPALSALVRPAHCCVSSSRTAHEQFQSGVCAKRCPARSTTRGVVPRTVLPKTSSVCTACRRGAGVLRLPAPTGSAAALCQRGTASGDACGRTQGAPGAQGAAVWHWDAAGEGSSDAGSDHRRVRGSRRHAVTVPRLPARSRTAPDAVGHTRSTITVSAAAVARRNRNRGTVLQCGAGWPTAMLAIAAVRQTGFLKKNKPNEDRSCEELNANE